MGHWTKRQAGCLARADWCKLGRCTEDSLSMPGRRIGRLRRLGFVAFALLAGTMIGLVLAEVGVNLVFRKNPRTVFSRRMSFVPSADPLAVYEYRPGASDPLFKINSHGFRGREVQFAKDHGVVRIACVGDSYTFGPGVETKNTWVERLQVHLGEQMRPTQVETLNFGVEAYGSSNELGLLRSKVLRFDPDLVILAHLVNDNLYDFIRIVRGNMVFYFEEDPDGRIPLPSAYKEAAYRYSLLYRLASTWYLDLFHKQIRTEQMKTVRGHFLAGDPGKTEQPKTQSGPVDVESIVEMHRLCEAHSTRMVIVDFPVTQNKIVRHRGKKAKAVSDQLQALAEARKIPYIDLFPVLRGLDGASLRIAPHDHHPNAELQELYAAAIARQLLTLYQPGTGKNQ